MSVLNGLYLVITPKQSESELLEKLRKALQNGLGAVQLYNDWPRAFAHTDKLQLIQKIHAVCREFNTPFLLNNEWELLKDVRVEGVHFDTLPDGWPQQKKALGFSMITGLTLTNDLSVLGDLDTLEVDYLSFCAMFPSSSVASCEIVDPKNVAITLEKVNLPVFISGGVTPENIAVFKSMPISGVAVISGIMNSSAPDEAVTAYKNALNQFT
jgi:thiamine-phosphate pyrophosphorylase